MVKMRQEQKESIMAKRMTTLLVATIGTICQVRCEAVKTMMPTPTNTVVAAVIVPTHCKPFDIPPSLIHRMTMAHNAARNRLLGISIDTEELFASDGNGGDFTNAHAIAARPRGEMKFCDDRLNDKEREKLWPFDVESFEKSLEAKMSRDSKGRFRFKDESAKEVGTANGDGLAAPNPTFRWVNHEIEEWAVKQLDGKFTRMDEKSFCKTFGYGEMPDGTFAWTLSNLGEYFVIQRCEGAWHRREYRYVLKRAKMKRGVPVASFDSFPSRKEAAAMRTYGRNAAAMNNLAVLEWQHRNHRLSMIPARIKWFLETSNAEGVTEAETNLKVLRDHIPEVFKE